MKTHQLKKLEDLRASPTNPRTISEQAKKGLRYSLDQFGDISGIVWNERSGNLVCGHQRLNELKELGAELKSYGDRDFVELPDGSRFAVRKVSWDEDKEAAANLAANNEEIAGRWIPETAEIIAKIRDRSDDMYEAMNLKLLYDRVAVSQADWSKAFDSVPSREVSEFETMTFSLSAAAAATIRRAIEKAKKNLDGGHNLNGRALLVIAESFNGPSEDDCSATDNKE